MSRYFSLGHNWQESPVELPILDVGLRPTPVEGCSVCAHAAAWRKAYDTGTPGGYVDKSKAVDCSVEIRNHPHEPRVMALPVATPGEADA